MAGAPVLARLCRWVALLELIRPRPLRSAHSARCPTHIYLAVCYQLRVHLGLG